MIRLRQTLSCWRRRIVLYFNEKICDLRQTMKRRTCCWPSNYHTNHPKADGITLKLSLQPKSALRGCPLQYMQYIQNTQTNFIVYRTYYIKLNFDCVEVSAKLFFSHQNVYRFCIWNARYFFKTFPERYSQNTFIMTCCGSLEHIVPNWCIFEKVIFAQNAL